MAYRKFLFIWIPKTGGTSIWDMTGSKNSVFDYKKVKTNYTGFVTFNHICYTDLLKKGNLSKLFHRQSFKFTFCRNPYDRAISLYRWNKMKQRHDYSFLDFCRSLDNIHKIGLHNVKGLSQCNPQVSWIDGVSLNFVGRFEHFERDVKKAFSLCGKPIESVKHSNRVDVKIFQKERYQASYCDESRQIVEHYYDKDFKYFSYNKILEPVC